LDLAGGFRQIVEEGKPTRAFERRQHSSRMAFGGPPGKFPTLTPGSTTTKRLRLHETVLVRHRRLWPLGARYHERSGPLSSPIIAQHRIVYSIGTILSNLLAEATLAKQRKR
jgi:hypothetical protein